MNDKSEIELIQVLETIHKNFKSIFSFSIIVSFIIFGLTFLLNDRYTSNATLMLTGDNEENQSSSIMGSLSKVASISGINTGITQGNKIYFATETFKSRDFFKQLVEDNLILVYLKYPSKFNDDNDELKKQDLNVSLLDVYKHIYLEDFSASIDDDTGFVRIEFTHQSPVFAYEFLSLIISKINQVAKNKELEKSERSLVYLQEKASSSNQRNIKESISYLIEQQLKKQMLANIDENYLLTPIDSPFIPREKSFPARFIILIVSFIFLVILSSIYFVISFNYKNQQ